MIGSGGSRGIRPMAGTDLARRPCPLTSGSLRTETAMRGPVLAFCLVVALLGLERSGVAVAAEASTTTSSAAGRVGSLSPDEQRRALRARQRAAAKATSPDMQTPDRPAPPSTADPAPSHQAAVAAGVETPRHRASTGTSHRRLSARREARYRHDARVRQDPRVGDVVPGDVRLYAIPAADEHDLYTGYPRSPPGFPPFPRP